MIYNRTAVVVEVSVEELFYCFASAQFGEIITRVPCITVTSVHPRQIYRPFGNIAYPAYNHMMLTNCLVTAYVISQSQRTPKPPARLSLLFVSVVIDGAAESPPDSILGVRFAYS